MAMTLCDKCGQAFNDKENKCPNCGAENTSNRKSRNTNKWLIISPIAIFVLAICFFVFKDCISSSTQNKTELLEITLQNGSKGYVNPQPKLQNRWTIYFNAAIEALKNNGASLVNIEESDIKSYVVISDGRFYVPVEYIKWFNQGHNFISENEIQSFCKLVNSGNIFTSSNPMYLNLYGEIQQNLDYEFNKQRSIENLQQEASEINGLINYGSTASVEEVTGYRVRLFMIQRILKEKGVDI